MSPQSPQTQARPGVFSVAPPCAADQCRDPGVRSWARSWTYPSATVSVPRCRRSVVEVLRDHGVTGDPLETAALLVTELAGNAVEHAERGVSGDGDGGVSGDGGEGAADRFTVVLTRRGRRLRIEVRDGGGRLPPRRPPAVPDLNATAGRGLFLVEALSFRWGVRSAAGGKCVWCELAC